MARTTKKSKPKVEEQQEGEVKTERETRASHKRKNLSPPSSPENSKRQQLQDKSQLDKSNKEAEVQTAEDFNTTEEVSKVKQDKVTNANEEINSSPKRKKLTSTQILDQEALISDTEQPQDKTNGDLKNSEEGKTTSSPPPSPSSPSSSPNSILRSPGKSPKIPKSPSQVKFQGVEIRQYNRCHGGSAGIPHQGAYPLGLDWSYDKNVMTRTVSDFEQDKNTTSISDGVHYLAEKDRKKLLEKFDEREDMTRAGSFQREKTELSQIRESRKHIGCGCKGACSTKKCQCVKQGIECNESSCGCQSDTCGNSRAETMEQNMLDKFRKKKIQEANREGMKLPVKRKLKL